MAVAHRRVLGVAGDEQHLQVRPQDAARIGDLAPVHAAGKPDIRDQKVEAHVRLQHLEAGWAVGGLDRGIAEILQHLRHQHPHRRLVIDDQHRLALLGAGRGGQIRGRLGLFRRPVMARQVEAHRRALADLRVDPHLPARLAHEAVDHRQAEARALADRLRREERVERLGDDIRAHAGAGIGHAEREVLAGIEVALLGATVVEPFVGGLDGDAPAIRHRVAGVDAEVEQRILELARIDQHRPQPARGHHFEGDRRADGAAEQILHAHHQPVHVGGLRVQGLAPREGEQAVGQRRRALGGTLRGVDVAVDLGDPPLREAGLQQFERAGDAGEQIVEVMGEPAGELAHRLHLLALAQGLLGSHQLGGASCDLLLQACVERLQLRLGAQLALDVARLDHRADRHAALVADRARGEGDGVERAVAVDEDLLALLLVVLGKGLIDRAFVERVGAAVRPGMVDDVVQRLAVRLVEAVAGQPLGGAVHVGAVLALIHHEDRLRRVVEHRVEAAGGLDETLLGRLPRGDVDGAADAAQAAALRIEHAAPLGRDPADRAVGAADRAELLVVEGAGHRIEGGGEGGGDPRPVVRVEAVGEVVEGHVRIGRQPEHRLDPRRPE